MLGHIKTIKVKHNSIDFEIDNHLNIYKLSYQGRVYLPSLYFMDHIPIATKQFLQDQNQGLVVDNLLCKIQFKISITNQKQKTILFAQAKLKMIAFSFIFEIYDNKVFIISKITSNVNMFYRASMIIEAQALNINNHMIKAPFKKFEFAIDYTQLYQIYNHNNRTSIQSSYDALTTNKNTIILAPSNDLRTKRGTRSWHIRPNRIEKNYNTTTLMFID